MPRPPYSRRPKADEARMRLAVQTQAQRKVFHCIVDDTALVHGAKNSTRDGIRKWVDQGAIRLYVPLYTLEQLDCLKQSNEQVGTEALEAIMWLDHVCEPDAVQSGSVQLQGDLECYESWDIVEQYLIPERTFSMDDTEPAEDYVDDLEDDLAHLDMSDEQSMSSSRSLEEPPKTPQSAVSALSMGVHTDEANKGLLKLDTSVPATLSTERTSSVRTTSPDKKLRQVVPDYLKPFFNHVVWRINQASTSYADGGFVFFILLTNDPVKQTIAQKFGIRAKRLEQIRDAIAHEDREARNRQAYFKKEAEDAKMRTTLDQTNNKQKSPTRQKWVHDRAEKEHDSEDANLLNRAPKGPQAQTTNGHPVFDPNDFGRNNMQIAGRGAGGRGGFAPRGRGSLPPRGRSFVPRGMYIPPRPPTGSPRPHPVDPNQPIDPDSFVRPVTRTPYMRGGRRRLWEPN